MRVLMVGVDEQTKGGMWTVAENYLHSEAFVRSTNLEYVSTSITGSIPKRLLFTAKALLRIVSKLIGSKYDIVHIHMAERGSVYRKNIVICLAKLFHCKVLIHMHGAEFEPWYRSLKPRKQEGIRKILRKADKIVILGKYWEEFIRSLVVDQDRVCVLHNAVYVPAENLYNSDACNLLFLGVAGQRKGFYDLLKAMKQIEPQLPAGTMLTVYGPEGERSVDEAIRELDLSSCVQYRGWLSNDQKTEVFANTALNILPSYHEGLPMTILETMAYGIPNISTNVAAIPEAVDQENGAVVCPGDVDGLAQAIMRIMNDGDSRKQKSQLAYEKAKTEFSIDNHIAKLLDMYQELKHEA